MKFFASWWERVPARVSAPVLALGLVGLGTLFDFAQFIQVFAHISGSIWD